MEGELTVRTLSFTAPYEVSVIEEPTPEPGPGEVLVRTDRSAISPGTELLVYRGEAPTDLDADATIDALEGSLSYPLRYGYACVGTVCELGSAVPETWRGRTVFGFQPHASHFVAEPDALHPVPDDVSFEAATLLPNVEAAVNFAMDARPAIGERAVVLGQGIVGLLTTSLLSRYPLDRLVTVERHAQRRALSRSFGADAALGPDDSAAESIENRLASLLDGQESPGADLTIELTGDPGALDLALSATGYSGRVIVGSWYGNRRASVDLGGAFHRNRIEVVSSQVSTVDPARSGRFTKERRLGVTWNQLRSIDVDRLLTHRIPIERAPEAYRLLDERPDEAVGVVFTYE